MRDKDRMHTFCILSPNITTSQEHSMLNCHYRTDIYHRNRPNTRTKSTQEKDFRFANCTNIYHHPLLTSVGLANLLPKFTVTRLCNATVLISKGKGCAELSPTAVGAGALAATWL